MTAPSSEKLSDFCVSPEATFIDAIAKIERNHTRSALVLSGQKVIGVLSEGDILRALLNGADVYSPIKPFVQKSFKYLLKEDDAEFLGFVKRFGITMAPILGEDFSLKGVMKLQDLLSRMMLKE